MVDLSCGGLMWICCMVARGKQSHLLVQVLNLSQDWSLTKTMSFDTIEINLVQAGARLGSTLAAKICLEIKYGYNKLACKISTSYVV